MSESLEVSAIIPAPPDRIYRAWLNSDRHTDMTGGGATISAKVGGEFSAWDGYIEGKTLELDPGRRIVQSWRTSQFPSGSPDSRIEILFADAPGGTRLTIRQTNIPDGQAELYTKGWSEFYFDPMTKYFASDQD